MFIKACQERGKNENLEQIDYVEHFKTKKDPSSITLKGPKVGDNLLSR